jgi:ABC-type polar amino acid transport system ATPase subunit
VVAIIGPSGSGKTTLLRINLLEQPEGGTIRVGISPLIPGNPSASRKG